MEWVRFVDPDNGIAQYVDFPVAEAWLARANELTTDANIARLQERPWAEQWRAIDDAWSAYTRVFRAMTLPWYDPGVWDATGTATAATNMQREMQRALQGVGERCSVVGWVARAWIDPQQSVLHTQCLQDRPREGEGCDFDGLFSGCFTPPNTTQGCDPYTWNTIAWKGGVSDIEGGNECSVLPPAVYYMDRVKMYAREAATRGVRRILVDTRLGILIRNIREAARVGVEFPEDLQEAAANVAVQAARARWNDPRLQQAAAVFNTAAAATSAVPVVSAVLGLLGALTSVAPGASGSDPATTPTYIRPWIPGTNSITAPGPAYARTVGEPPGWVRPHVVDQIAFLPGLALGGGAPGINPPAAGAEVIGVPGFTFTEQGAQGTSQGQQSSMSPGAKVALGLGAAGAVALAVRAARRGRRRG